MEENNNLNDLTQKFGLPVRKTIIVKSENTLSCNRQYISQNNTLDQSQRKIEKEAQRQANKYLSKNSNYFKRKIIQKETQNQQSKQIVQKNLNVNNMENSWMHYSQMYDKKNINKSINYLKIENKNNTQQKGIRENNCQYQEFFSQIEKEILDTKNQEEKEADEIIIEVFKKAKLKLETEKMIPLKSIQLINKNKNVEDGD